MIQKVGKRADESEVVRWERGERKKSKKGDRVDGW
jgi:hypothetical protein